MYIFKYKRKNSLFYRSLKAKGHQLDPQLKIMTVYLHSGGVQTIPQWDQCYLKLGLDFEIQQKKEMEKEAGQPIVTQN